MSFITQGGLAEKELFRFRTCECAPAVVTKYQKRISRQILDHIDIRNEVPRVDYETLSDNRSGETSESIRKRVQATRDSQQKRFTNSNSDIVCNANMRVVWMRFLQGTS